MQPNIVSALFRAMPWNRYSNCLFFSKSKGKYSRAQGHKDQCSCVPNQEPWTDCSPCSFHPFRYLVGNRLAQQSWRYCESFKLLLILNYWVVCGTGYNLYMNNIGFLDNVNSNICQSVYVRTFKGCFRKKICNIWLLLTKLIFCSVFSISWFYLNADYI